MSLRAQLGLPADASDADVLDHITAHPQRTGLALLGVTATDLSPAQSARWAAEGRLSGPQGEPALALTMCHLNGTMFLYADMDIMDEPGFPNHALPIDRFAVGPTPDDVDGGPPPVAWVHVQYGPEAHDSCTVWVPDDLEMMVPQDGPRPLDDAEMTGEE